MIKKNRPKDAAQGEAVGNLHRTVDELASVLAEKHESRLQCRLGCHGCCLDELTVFAAEAQVIQIHYPQLLAHDEPAPIGQCAFLDQNGGCRIYDHRPYVCRTQGLPLRWLETTEEEVVEYRDICPLNENDAPLEALEEGDFWTLGEWEGRLAGLQTALEGRLRRVALRDLFHKKTTRRATETGRDATGWEV